MQVEKDNRVRNRIWQTTLEQLDTCYESLQLYIYTTCICSMSKVGRVLRYCRNVRPTWVKFNSKDTKESGWVFEVLSTKSKKRT